MNKKLQDTSKINDIYRASEELFATKGYDGVSISDIASLAGTSKSLIYHHFENKQQLYEATIKKSVNRILNTIKPGIDKKQTPREKILSFIKQYLKAIKENKSLYYALVRETVNLESPSSKYVLSQSISVINILSQIIKEGIDKEEFKKINPDAAAFSLFGMLNAHVTEEAAIFAGVHQRKRNLNLDEIIQTNTEIFLEGIKIG